MPAYVMASVYDVTDPAGFGEYRNLAGPSVASFGGKFIAGSETVEVMEGDWSPMAFLVIEFESVEQAKRWYNSPEYQAVLPMRKNFTNSGLIMGAGR